MKGFRCTAAIFLALACLASSFLFPPQPTTAAVFGSGTKRGNTRAVATLPKFTSLVHAATLPLAAPPADTMGSIMMVSPRGGKGMEDDGDGDSEKQSDGIETKYLVAAGVFVLAALYDLFVTHQGRLWEF